MYGHYQADILQHPAQLVGDYFGQWLHFGLYFPIGSLGVLLIDLFALFFEILAGLSFSSGVSISMRLYRFLKKRPPH